MAAYGVLCSLLNVIHDIQNHHCPPISLDPQQVESLLEKVNFLLGFLEGYTSPFDDVGGEPDPLEIRIVDAAYAAEDVIESHIAGVIKMAIPTTTKSPDPKSSFSSNQENDDSSGENGDSGEENSDFGEENGDSGEENDDSSGGNGDSGEENSDFGEENDDSGEENDDSGQENGDSGEENDDSGEENDESGGKNGDSGEENDDSSKKNDESGDESRWGWSNEVNSGEELSCIKLFEDLHQVIQELDLIMKEAMNIDAEKAVVHHQRHRNVSTSDDADADATSKDASSSNTTTVCPDEVLNGIMEKLVLGSPSRHAISIVGMGGIGKTTLARTVYSQPLIKEYFHVCAWVAISEQYNLGKILFELISQLDKQSESSGDQLGLDIHQCLFGRRYLIVLDDMWGIGAWNEIQRFFPDNDNGSRILVTTRLSQLSSQLNSNYILQMEFLDRVSSWDLFSRIVFGKGECPIELEEIGKEIVQNCRGLPLSIVAVGGILKKKEFTQKCWETVKNNLTSAVNLENEEHCLRLLKTSYNHLPVYLKPLFLCIGVFAEDTIIYGSKLIRQWFAEGFLKPMNGKRVVETIARGFLNDLVDRNLIQPQKFGSTGKLKYFKIHDLIRDMCMRENRRFGFYHVVEEVSFQGVPNRQRRFVVRTGTSEKKIQDSLQSMSHTRSVFYEFEAVPQQLNFGLLRTLEAYDVRSNERYLNALVFECVNLRNLAVRVDNISKFLSSINLVWNLQSLIVSGSQESIVPVGIWKMPQFRRIVHTGEYLCFPNPPSRNEGDTFVVMENLEILQGVKNLKLTKDVVKRIPNIKKLGLDISKENAYFLRNVGCLCKLEALELWCDEMKGVVTSMYDLTFPHSLTSLKLGMNEETEWEEILENICSLPHLQKLKMLYGCFKREENKWETVEGKFCSLKYLELVKCNGLRHWTTHDNYIFPRLEKLCLYGLSELEEIPYEIGDIPTLRKIKMKDCSESAVKCVKEIVEQQVELQGDEQLLSFDVKVRVLRKYGALQSLETPKFTVEVYGD